MKLPQMRQVAVGALLFAATLFPAPTYSQAQQSADGPRKVLVKTPVPYPGLARTLMLRGVVRVEADVAPNGTVKSVELKGGHPILAESAISAVQRWKFEPASHETRELIEVRFEPGM
jgi:TonB family protein